MYRKIMGFLEAWKESEHRNFCILYLSKLGRHQLVKLGISRDDHYQMYERIIRTFEELPPI